MPFFVWLVATLVLGAGGALLFRRRRAGYAFAGADGDEIAERSVDERTAAPAAPTPAPAPTPTETPAPKVPSVPAGLVSTRLRPWLEIGFHPVRCVLDHQRAAIDFELELFNSGSAPARDVVVAATAFNAGPTQDEMIGSFFSRPSGQGHRVALIQPLERTVVPLQLVMPRDQLQPYDLGGQQVFVPLIAFNTTYGWATNAGQSSASYLLGRQTNSDKLGPFALGGSRTFGTLAAKPLPLSVRR